MDRFDHDFTERLNFKPMSDDQYTEDGGGLQLEEARPKLKKPPMYQVVLINDDYTPMEFVIQILEVFFNMNQEKAASIMLQVHNHGKGVCGVFSREIAETKVSQVNTYSRQSQHPLLCTMEKTDQ